MERVLRGRRRAEEKPWHTISQTAMPSVTEPAQTAAGHCHGLRGPLRRVTVATMITSLGTGGIMVVAVAAAIAVTDRRLTTAAATTS